MRAAPFSSFLNRQRVCEWSDIGSSGGFRVFRCEEKALIVQSTLPVSKTDDYDAMCNHMKRGQVNPRGKINSMAIRREASRE
jgi:hypothetical protein